MDEKIKELRSAIDRRIKDTKVSGRMVLKTLSDKYINLWNSITPSERENAINGMFPPEEKEIISSLKLEKASELEKKALIYLGEGKITFKPEETRKVVDLIKYPEVTRVYRRNFINPAWIKDALKEPKLHPYALRDVLMNQAYETPDVVDIEKADLLKHYFGEEEFNNAVKKLPSIDEIRHEFFQRVKRQSGSTYTNIEELLNKPVLDKGVLTKVIGKSKSVEDLVKTLSKESPIAVATDWSRPLFNPYASVLHARDLKKKGFGGNLNKKGTDILAQFYRTKEVKSPLISVGQDLESLTGSGHVDKYVKQLMFSRKLQMKVKNTVKPVKDGWLIDVMRVGSPEARAETSPGTFFMVEPDATHYPRGYTHNWYEITQGKPSPAYRGIVGGDKLYRGKIKLSNPLIVKIPSGWDSGKMILPSIAEKIGFKWNHNKEYFSNEEALLKHVKNKGHDGIIIYRELPKRAIQEAERRGMPFLFDDLPYQTIVLKGTKAHDLMKKSLRKISDRELGFRLLRGKGMRLPALIGALTGTILGSIGKKAAAALTPIGVLDDYTGGAILPESLNEDEASQLKKYSMNK